MKRGTQWFLSMLKIIGRNSPRTLKLIGRLDLKLGAIGYSLILADVLVETGNVQIAERMVAENLDELIQRTKPKKIPRSGIASAQPNQYLAVPQSVKAEALNHIVTHLERYGIRPFLAFGTLLGMVREQRFMLHDGDMDLGILTSEATAKKVKPIFKKIGFKVTHYEQDETHPWPCRLKLENDKGVKVDVVFFHLCENHLLTYCRYRGEILIRKRTPFTLKSSEFLGHHIWIPDPPEQFLSENYGNWKEPTPFYHHIISSELTDHTLDLVKYCAKRTLYRLLILGEYGKAQGLINQMLKRNVEMGFWIKLADRFTNFLMKK